MILSVSIFFRYLINLIVIALIGLVAKELLKKIKFLYHYFEFPKDSNGSFLFGDFLKFGVWKTKFADSKSNY